VEPVNRCFGHRVEDHSQNQKEDACLVIAGVGKEHHEEKSAGRAHDDQGEDEQDDPQEDVRGPELADRFLLHPLILIRAEEAFAGPVLQELLGALRFFARRTVDLHVCLPKRRAIETSAMSIAMPVTTK
jgi:hypothetical protein